MSQKNITVKTPGKGLHKITDRIRNQVQNSDVSAGVCSLFLRHTSASLLIQENAAPSAKRDLEEFFNRYVPENESWYTHTSEGPDDMPSHIRAALTNTSETIPIVDGSLDLGTWQGIYLFEHRRQGRSRSIRITLLPAE